MIKYQRSRRGGWDLEVHLYRNCHVKLSYRRSVVSSDGTRRSTELFLRLVRAVSR